MNLLIVAALIIATVFLWSQHVERRHVLYFAYGSNTNERHFQNRIPSAKCEGTGYLHDHSVKLERFATLVHNPGSTVKGVVWCISRDDLPMLDEIEENYTRKPVTIFTNRSKQADTYYMNTPENDPPSKEYVNVVETGYLEHGIPWNQIVGSDK